MTKRPIVILIVCMILILSVPGQAFAAYKNDSIRVTYNSPIVIGSNGWYVTNLTDKEYVSIMALKIVPGVGTYVSLTEGDWAAVATDAALALIGQTTSKSLILIAKNGNNAVEAGKYISSGSTIVSTISSVNRKVKNGKVTYDSIKLVNGTIKNCVVTKEEVRMKKNDLVLKMIAESWSDTYWVSSTKLEIYDDSYYTQFSNESIPASKKGIQWCVDQYSEFVYKGYVTSDDFGITECLYNEIADTAF